MTNQTINNNALAWDTLLLKRYRSRIYQLRSGINPIGDRALHVKDCPIAKHCRNREVGFRAAVHEVLCWERME